MPHRCRLPCHTSLWPRWPRAFGSFWWLGHPGHPGHLGHCLNHVFGWPGLGLTWADRKPNLSSFNIKVQQDNTGYTKISRAVLHPSNSIHQVYLFIIFYQVIQQLLGNNRDLNTCLDWRQEQQLLTHCAHCIHCTMCLWQDALTKQSRPAKAHLKFPLQGAAWTTAPNIPRLSG